VETPWIFINGRFIRSLPIGLRGFAAIPTTTALNSGDPWTYAMVHWDSGEYANFQAQVDAVKAAGGNVMRWNGSPHAVLGGLVTRAKYIANWKQITEYMLKQGIYHYVSLGGPPDYGDGAGGTASDSAIIAEVGPFVASQAGYPNVIGFDLCLEAKNCVNGGMVRTGVSGYSQPITWSHLNTLLAGMKAAAVAAAPGHSHTMSSYGTDNESNLYYDSVNALYINPHIDHFDEHAYTDATQSSTALSSVLSGGRQVIIGESGHPTITTDYPASLGQLLPSTQISAFAGILVWNPVANLMGTSTVRTNILTALSAYPYKRAFYPFARSRRS
jgi:hypothetical protein